jgi:HEPN domain-containing protein
MAVMPIDVEKQIAFWRAGAEDALASAELLIANKRWGYGMFLLHLALEKSLKGLVVRHTGDVPPRTHDLLRLTQEAGLTPPNKALTVLGEFQVYCLSARYPDSEPVMMEATLAQHELSRANEAYAWLQKQFSEQCGNT